MSEEQGPDSAMRIDTTLVEELAALLASNDLSEIEVQYGERRIVVKRKISAGPYAAPVAAAPPPATATAGAAAAPSAAAENNPASNAGAVKSPMVGTVYLAPEPGASPFVAPGVRVEAGDTLLIIEAMKVMNPIQAPRAGTVRQVCVEDSQPVEFDQVLVVIE